MVSLLTQYAPIVAAAAYLVYAIASAQTSLIGPAVAAFITAIAGAANTHQVAKVHNRLGQLDAVRAFARAYAIPPKTIPEDGK